VKGWVDERRQERFERVMLRLVDHITVEWWSDASIHYYGKDTYAGGEVNLEGW
jgi:hypothetical protein